VSVSTVDFAALQGLLDSGAQLVEVLDAEGYDRLHIPRAINIPLTQLTREAAKQLDPRRDVVVYCWDDL
jgi:rhodanese-related sulfurtransferase